MPSATLERILDEVKRLTPEERRVLREALDREAVRAAAPPPVWTDDRWERERRWLDEHREEYLGQWVALEGGRLPANGADGWAVYEAGSARRAVEKYRDYKGALRDGYEILLPDVPRKMYHFNNAARYTEAERHFNVERPTSLLYERSGGGYRLIGVMYTAPALLTEDELDSRVPLSVAAWHQHVNVCLPEGDPLRNLFGVGPRSGLEGSVTTEGECREAGGRFYPRLFGWMVHLYPYERDAREMWSVERQVGGGAGHAH
jgi:hypothetical protein